MPAEQPPVVVDAAGTGSEHAGIAERLARYGVEFSDEQALDSALAQPATRLGDGRLLVTPALIDGRILTHRVAGDDLVAGWLPVHPDLSALAAFATSFDLGGDEARIVTGASDPSLGLPAGQAALVGPPGWLDGFSVGDLVAVAVAGGRLGLERTEPDPAPAPGIVEALRAQVPVSVSATTLGIELLVAHPDRWRSPELPIGELLQRAGLRADGDAVVPSVSSPAEAPSVAAPVAPAASALLDEVWAAFAAHRRGQPVDGAAVARALGNPDVASAFAEAAVGGDAADHAGFRAFADDLAARGPVTAGVAFLAGRAAELAGEPAAMERWVRRAIEETARFGPAHLDAAWFASDRGDAGRALSELINGGVEPDDPELSLLRTYTLPGPDRVGRNDPCPCGSGKKYKACHARYDGHMLPSRVPWLYAKAVTFAQRAPQRAALFALARRYAGVADGAGADASALLGAISDPVLTDVALFDGGLLERFAAERSALLPPDEAELVESWKPAHHRLWEVTTGDDAFELIDKADGSRASVIRTGGDVPERHVLAVIASDGSPDGRIALGRVVPVPAALVEATAAVVTDPPDAAGLAAFIGQHFGWTAAPSPPE